MSAIFPKWTNRLPLMIVIGLLLVGTAVTAGVWYYFTPMYTLVVYQPIQPVPFSHAIHAGQLGLDCRYCHTKIEKSSEANIPNVATCYGCHAEGRLVKFTSGDEAHVAKTNFIREAYAKDQSVEWTRVHKVPEYVRNFPHNVHLNAGVS